MLNEFHFDGEGNQFKIYASMPLRVHADDEGRPYKTFTEESTTMQTKTFQEAGERLDGLAVDFMEFNGTENYREALNSVMSENPELTKIYATGPTIRPAGDQMPYLKSVAAEVDRRTKTYLREHGLNPISDYDIALKIILDDDPELKEKYSRGGFNLWES